MAKGISVVVCCYNSADRLPPTLQHLAAQQALDFEWEILIIDNNSNDKTNELATQCWKEFNGHQNFNVVYESKAGLSNARKRGIDEAKYDLILFCDDDNWLDSTYLAKAYHFMEAHADIGVLGGLGIPVVEGRTPEWFDSVAKSYAVGQQAKYAGELHSKVLYGAGMVIRNAFLKKIYQLGIVSLLSDRKGKDLVSGGDNEICYWFKMAGLKLYYLDTMTFKHFIPSNRLTLEYLVKRAESKGKTEAIIKFYEKTMLGIGKQYTRIDWLRDLIVRMIYRIKFALAEESNLQQYLLKHLNKASFSFRFSNFDYLRICSIETLKYAEIIKRESPTLIHK